jgi:hypothetical protein
VTPTREHAAGTTTLVVARDAALPDVCIKCGATAALTRKKQRFHYTPPWAFAVFGLIGFVGFPDPTLAMLGSFAPLIGLSLLLATTRKGELQIALCAGCKRRWTAAMIVLALAALAPFVGLLALIASIVRFFQAAPGSSLFVGVGVGTVVTLCVSLLAPVFAHTAYAAPRLLGVKRIDARTITLSRVHPDAVARVRAQPVGEREGLGQRGVR